MLPINKRYFCSMSTKKFFTFGKIVALLLLISYSVAAKPILNVTEFQKQGKTAFNKVENAAHKNMLQPQVVHVTMMPEHTVNPANPSYFASTFTEESSSELSSNGQTTIILQDANRCESVSRLLFPFHIFW